MAELKEEDMPKNFLNSNPTPLLNFYWIVVDWKHDKIIYNLIIPFLAILLFTPYFLTCESF